MNADRKIREGKKNWNRKRKITILVKNEGTWIARKSQTKSLPFDTCKVFDVTKHIRPVPLFEEKETDQYFPHFEKVAENLKWLKVHWTLLLQSVVTGKAREIYIQLSVEQSSNYDTVKELILKAYELVPERKITRLM